MFHQYIQIQFQLLIIQELHQKTFDLQNNRNVWVKILEDLDVEIDIFLEKQKANDPDLWIIEVESSNGQNYLDEF